MKNAPFDIQVKQLRFVPFFDVSSNASMSGLKEEVFFRPRNAKISCSILGTSLKHGYIRN